MNTFGTVNTIDTIHTIDTSNINNTIDTRLERWSIFDSDAIPMFFM